MVEEDVDMDLEELKELEVKPAELKPVKRGKTPQPNPMEVPLLRTHATGKPLCVEVPARDAPAVGAKLRKAGMKQISVEVQYHILPEDEYRSEVAIKEMRDHDPDHLVRVVFQGYDPKS